MFIWAHANWDGYIAFRGDIVFLPSVAIWNCERAMKGPRRRKRNENEFSDHRPGSRDRVRGSTVCRSRREERHGDGEDHRDREEASQEAHEKGGEHRRGSGSSGEEVVVFGAGRAS